MKTSQVPSRFTSTHPQRRTDMRVKNTLIASTNYAILLIALAFAPAVQAQNLVVNGSFENTHGTFADNGLGYMSLPVGATVIPGWTVTGNTLAWVDNGNYYGVGTPYGSLLLDLTDARDNGSWGGVMQTIPTSVGQTYRLCVAGGSYLGNPASGGPKSIFVTAGTTSASFTSAPTGTRNSWDVFSFTFVASASSTTITIVGTGDGGGNEYLGLDRVSVTPSDGNSDDDCDGVSNPTDQCPNSDFSPTVVIDGCDSNVANILVSHGCTINDLISGYAVAAKNHGEFVSLVSQLTASLIQQDLITGFQKAAIEKCAARSSIGR